MIYGNMNNVIYEITVVEKLPADLPYVIRKTCQTSKKLLLLLQEKAALMRKYIRKGFAWTGSGSSEGIG